MNFLIPDKKPTDNDIVKALECCVETSGVNCGKCPYCDNCVTDENTSLMMTDALDLINRQKAEIERLKKGWKADVILTANVKSEAYREFAERIKIRFAGTLQCSSWVIQKAVDNILKELVGDSNG